MKKYVKKQQKQKVSDNGFKTISKASGKIAVKERPKYIIADITAYPPTESGHPLRVRVWNVELQFISSGDVSKLTLEQLGKSLIDILQAHPIQP